MLRPRPPAPARLPQFDMTPMIDVTFQLIIFFMLIMDMSSVQTEKLKQPTARHAVAGHDPDEVVVNISADGKLRVFGKTLSDEALERLLEAQARSRRGDFPLLIRADRSAPFEAIQKVMMMSQAHGGVKRLGFGAAMEVNR
jgi:biopolymer transport protein ExbD